MMKMNGRENPIEPVVPPAGVACAKCGHENPHGQTHCASCGSHLHVVCQHCGHRTERSRRRCPECGGKLHRSWRRRTTRSLLGQDRRKLLSQIVLLVVAIVLGLIFIVYFSEWHTPEAEP
ncbi:MAG: zinc ribbon domain-containing protein [Verrucomicrobiota bacterium]